MAGEPGDDLIHQLSSKAGDILHLFVPDVDSFRTTIGESSLCGKSAESVTWWAELEDSFDVVGLNTTSDAELSDSLHVV